MLLFLKGIAGGGIAGFFSGLLGIGSGSIIVPFLYLLFLLPIKVAIGTSLFIIFFSSMSGFLIHLKEKNLDIKLAFLLTIGGVIGAQTGAKLTKLLPDTIVKIVFIVVIVFLGFRLLISKERKYQSDKNGYTLSVWKTFLIGFLGGVVSGLCGVGGAIFLV
ncbi:sulfite exporter TauE/SafE family protein, partial [bacterium]|nr:sulfite exporter TauE/SafE family protein [bacterium]